MASLIIDDISFDCASYDVSATNKNKDYEMSDGSITRYVIAENLIALSCRIIADKSELDVLTNILQDDVEHIVQYRYNGLKSIYAFLSGTVSSKKIVFIGLTDELWEVSFSFKECRRD